MTHTNIDTLKAWIRSHRTKVPAVLLALLCVLSSVLVSQLTSEDFSARVLQDYTVHTSSSHSSARSPVALRRARRVEQQKSRGISTPKKKVSLHAAAPLQTKLVARADISVPMSSSSFSSSVATEDFPAFDHTVMPVSMVPNWGAMHSPEIWNRSYADMRPEEFVPVPRYNLSSLTVPLNDLTNDDSAESVATVTAKLFYSTRFFGAYDLDSGEFEAVHPGVDLKLARGTPIGAIAGGRVQTVARNASMGLHVIIEHHLPDGTVMYSIYGHFDVALVEEGESVSPGTPVGVVGMTGNTSGPHVHLQVDTDNGTSPHKPYWPSDVPTRAEAAKFTVNPVIFIATYGK